MSAIESSGTNIDGTSSGGGSATKPSLQLVEYLEQIVTIEEEDVTPEIREWLIRRQARTLKDLYHQVSFAVKFTEDDIDDLLKNSIDTHVHGGSDPFERLLYEDEIGIDFTQAGMRAMAVKSWYTPSASRNAMVQRAVDRYAEMRGLRPTLCLGGITLSYAIGGFNPDAVRKCIGYPGMKYVWTPAVESYHHQRVANDNWSGYGLKFTDEHYDIIPEMQEILRVIADNDWVLAVGHYPYEDAAALIEEARRLRVTRIEVVHPSMVHSKHTIEQLKQQVARGAKLMFHSQGLVAYPMELEPLYAVRMIREVGAEHFVHGGDWGQTYNLAHVVAIRWSIKTLLSYGITQQEVRSIYQDAPAELMGLPRLSVEEKARVPSVPRAGSGRSENVTISKA